MQVEEGGVRHLHGSGTSVLATSNPGVLLIRWGSGCAACVVGIERRKRRGDTLGALVFLSANFGYSTSIIRMAPMSQQAH